MGDARRPPRTSRRRSPGNPAGDGAERAGAVAEQPHERLEKDEEKLGDDFMERHGYFSVHFSQARATNQTPGIPDRKYYHVGWRHTLWWEAKKVGGRQRKAQREFQQRAEACGEEYVLGTFEVLQAHMRARLPELRRRIA